MIKCRQISLNNLNNRRNIMIDSLNCAHELKEKLLKMGLAPGTIINVSGAGKNGPFLINYGNSRLAVDYNTAEKIICSVC